MSLAVIIAVTVDVTRKHLAEGRPGNCRLCALALAVAGAVEDATGARVYHYGTGARADVTLAGGSTLVLGLGPDVAAAMARIDAGKPAGPFAFVAEVLDEITEEATA